MVGGSGEKEGGNWIYAGPGYLNALPQKNKSGLRTQKFIPRVGKLYFSILSLHKRRFPLPKMKVHGYFCLACREGSAVLYETNINKVLTIDSCPKDYWALRQIRVLQSSVSQNENENENENEVKQNDGWMTFLWPYLEASIIGSGLTHLSIVDASSWVGSGLAWLSGVERAPVTCHFFLFKFCPARFFFLSSLFSFTFFSPWLPTAFTSSVMYKHNKCLSAPDKWWRYSCTVYETCHSLAHTVFSFPHW